jgi:hypothetical protein
MKINLTVVVLEPDERREVCRDCQQIWELGLSAHPFASRATLYVRKMTAEVNAISPDTALVATQSSDTATPANVA